MTLLSHTRMISTTLSRRIAHVPHRIAGTSASSWNQRVVMMSTGLRANCSHVDETLQASNIKAVFRSMAMQDDDLHNDLAYSLSFADDSHDIDGGAAGAWQFSVLSDPRMLSQLEKSRNQCIPIRPVDQTLNTQALPKTLTDALRPSRRAIVITECTAPFRIWNVNPAWEELCGYSFLESRGKTLGSLLKGKETDTVAATGLIAKLLQGEEEVGTTLINYNKDGRAFKNRVRVGPIYDDRRNLTHFVGILQQVSA